MIWGQTSRTLPILMFHEGGQLLQQHLAWAPRKGFCHLSPLGPKFPPTPMLGESLTPLAPPHHSSRGTGRLPARTTDPTQAPPQHSSPPRGQGQVWGIFPSPGEQLQLLPLTRTAATREDRLEERAVSWLSKQGRKAKGLREEGPE